MDIKVGDAVIVAYKIMRVGADPNAPYQIGVYAQEGDEGVVKEISALENDIARPIQVEMKSGALKTFYPSCLHM